MQDKNKKLVAKIVEFQLQNKENVENARNQIIQLSMQLKQKSEEAEQSFHLKT